MSIPTSWQQVPLGELCEKLRDGSHNPPPAQSAGAPMLSARNITGRKVAFDEYRLISPQDFDEENRRTTVTEGDVLLTIVGAIGRSAVVTANYPPFTLQRSVAVLRQRAGDPRFLSYAFQAPLFQQYLNENAKGTAQKGIYLKALAGAEVPVAPVEEQRRIADKLDTVLARVDGVKDRLDRVAPLLKRFRQSVLGVATSGLTTKSDMGSAAHSSWRSTSLGEVCRKITDGEHLTPKRSESGRHLLSARNVRDGFIDLSKVDFVDESEFARLRQRCDPNIGDILMSCSGSVGRVALVDRDDSYVMVRSAALIRPDDSVLLPKYLMYVLRSPLLQAQIAEATRATAQANIFLGPIKKLALKLPSLQEQLEIVHRIELLFDYADRLEARLQAAQTAADRLTPALLAKAFRGELVPQDPNDEPASELLKRLAAQRTSGPAPGRQRRTAKLNTN